MAQNSLTAEFDGVGQDIDGAELDRIELALSAPVLFWAKSTGRFVNADGQRQLVRWSMRHVPEHFVDHAMLAKLGPDFLAQDLKQRVTQGPLSWRLVATLAQPSDPSNDATKVWPADRQHVDIGTLTVRQAQDEADGPCRDYNYPTILPVGIEVSDDPLLAARLLCLCEVVRSAYRGEC
jgi:catalase